MGFVWVVSTTLLAFTLSAALKMAEVGKASFIITLIREYFYQHALFWFRNFDWEVGVTVIQVTFIVVKISP